jgi:hypothetical protein
MTQGLQREGQPNLIKVLKTPTPLKTQVTQVIHDGQTDRWDHLMEMAQVETPQVLATEVEEGPGLEAAIILRTQGATEFTEVQEETPTPLQGHWRKD